MVATKSIPPLPLGLSFIGERLGEENSKITSFTVLWIILGCPEAWRKKYKNQVTQYPRKQLAIDQPDNVCHCQACRSNKKSTKHQDNQNIDVRINHVKKSTPAKEVLKNKVTDYSCKYYKNNHQIKLQSFPKYFDTFDILPLISYKHGIYELPHKLPNDLRLRILGN